MSFVFLITYSIVTTLYIIYLYFLRKNNYNLYDSIKDEINNISDVKKRIDLFTKIQEYKKLESPWYENLISTLGVLAFITMSITTLNQTYESVKNQTKLMDIKNDIKTFSRTKKTYDSYIKNTVKYILENKGESAKLSKNEISILKIRLNEIISNNIDNKYSAREAFTLAMLTKDYEIIQTIYAEHENDILTGSIYTKLYLAEYYFIRRNMILTNRIIKEIDETQITVKSSDRYYTLKWCLNDSNNNKYFSSLSKKKGVNRNTAKKIILEYSKHLKLEQEKL